MSDLLSAVRERFPAPPIPVAEMDGDQLFETVVNLTLREIPTSLGKYAGRVMVRMMSYGDFAGWGDQARDDAETFMARFHEGFKESLSGESTVPFAAERAEFIEQLDTLIVSWAKPLPC